MKKLFSFIIFMIVLSISVTAITDYMYVINSTAIIRSTNNWTTWDIVYNDSTANFSDIAISGGGKYVFVTDYGNNSDSSEKSILRSSNYGDTWTSSGDVFSHMSAIDISDNGQFVYINACPYLVYSPDYGNTWNTKNYTTIGSCLNTLNFYPTISTDTSGQYIYMTHPNTTSTGMKLISYSTDYAVTLTDGLLTGGSLSHIYFYGISDENNYAIKLVRSNAGTTSDAIISAVGINGGIAIEGCAGCNSYSTGILHDSVLREYNNKAYVLLYMAGSSNPHGAGLMIINNETNAGLTISNNSYTSTVWNKVLGSIANFRGVTAKNDLTKAMLISTTSIYLDTTTWNASAITLRNATFLDLKSLAISSGTLNDNVSLSEFNYTYYHNIYDIFASPYNYTEFFNICMTENYTCQYGIMVNDTFYSQQYLYCNDELISYCNNGCTNIMKDITTGETFHDAGEKSCAQFKSEQYFNSYAIDCNINNILYDYVTDINPSAWNPTFLALEFCDVFLDTSIYYLYNANCTTSTAQDLINNNPTHSFQTYGNCRNIYSGACINTCQLPQLTQCLDASTQQQCVEDVNGCLTWQDYSCANGQACIGGQCLINSTNIYNPSPEPSTDDGNVLVLSTGQKMFYVFLAIIFIIGGCYMVGYKSGVPTVGLFMGMFLSVLLLIASSIESFPYIGGFTPLWVIILFVIFCAGTLAIYIRNKVMTTGEG